MNLGETTNNHLESTFDKLKSVCNKYVKKSLMQFFLESLHFWEQLETIEITII